jgi:hypothetical protein
MKLLLAGASVAAVAAVVCPEGQVSAYKIGAVEFGMPEGKCVEFCGPEFAIGFLDGFKKGT